MTIWTMKTSYYGNWREIQCLLEQWREMEGNSMIIWTMKNELVWELAGNSLLIGTMAGIDVHCNWQEKNVELLAN